MSENLKSLASRIQGSIKVKNESVQDFYNYIVSNVFFRNQDYFSNFTHEELLKIILYVYSLKTTGNYAKAEQIFENSSFIIAFSTNDEEVSTTCSDCDGDGRQDCDECDGRGDVTCDECGGDGTVECSECGGDGVIDDEGTKCDECSGEGTIDCDDCGGEGSRECGVCDGTTRVDCENCDGEGEILSDDENYVQVYHIMSWNSSINDRAEIVSGTKESLSKDIDDLMETNEIIILFEPEHLSTIISDDYQDDEIYVYSFTDSPKLRAAGSWRSMRFQIDFSDYQFERSVRY